MYHEKLVCAIKVDGKILKENKDLVTLPYGCTYSILVKNLNSRRVKFTLHIDGTDVLEGTEIIVNANSEVEMKRFIKNSNMESGNCFKFIERSASIEDGPRGIKIDDGIIRIAYVFEQAPPKITTTYHTNVWNGYPHWWDGQNYRGINRVYASDIGSGIAQAQNAISSNDLKAEYCSSSAQTATGEQLSAPINEIGITVPGEKVDQKFTTVYGFNPESQSHVMIIRLAGKIGDVEVTKPVVINHKKECITCGKINKNSSKYCSSCGTFLEII